MHCIEVGEEYVDVGKWLVRHILWRRLQVQGHWKITLLSKTFQCLQAWTRLIKYEPGGV